MAKYGIRTGSTPGAGAGKGRGTYQGEGRGEIADSVRKAAAVDAAPPSDRANMARRHSAQKSPFSSAARPEDMGIRSEDGKVSRGQPR